MGTSSQINKKPQYVYPDSHVLVVGLGKSGFAAVKFFKHCGARVSVSDSSPRKMIDPGIIDWLSANNIRFETGGHTPEFFAAADLIVVSPGVALNLEPLTAARRRCTPIVGEMAIAAQYLRTPAVAITGTNGKTTVTTLLGDIFRTCGRKVFVGGNIGTPLFDYLTGPQDADVVVLEVSSFQLDTAGGTEGFRPEMALLLNISPDHLDRYETFSAYAASKFGIFAAQKLYDTAILNSDDREIMNRKHLWPSSQRYFFGEQLGEMDGAVIRDQSVILKGGTESMPGKETYNLAGTPMAEAPNLQNAAAAILAARLMGCRQTQIIEAIRNFKPLPHRLAKVAEINGISYYDDSKATNIGAVQAALLAMKQPVILIAGGRDKGGDYNLLADAIRQKVKAMMLIGEASKAMAEAFSTLVPVNCLTSLDEAVRKAHESAAPGDAVLLSPACSSFDMFSSYSQRGEVYRQSVLALKEIAGEH